jgi:enoyl-CoA hydratase/carnithine racemase
MLTAEQAMGVGLVSRVLPSELFEEDVGVVLSMMAAGSAVALALIKRQLYAIDGLSFSDAIALGAKVNATARSTPDFARAVSQFLDKK